jgi:hypothetical protein
MQVVITKTEPPQWLLDMRKEIDDKTFGKSTASRRMPSAT